MQALNKLVGALLISTFMLQIGLTLAPRALRDEVRHIGRLLRGLFFFLVVAPLTASLVARAFQVGPPSAVALVLLSCVGVAPLAARSARKAHGDVALAIVLTVALGVLTIFTGPPTASWLLGYTGHVPLHPRVLIPQLAILEGAPLLLGVLVRARTRHGQAIERVVGWLNTAAFVACFALVVAPHAGAVTAPGWLGAGATVVLALLAAAGGYLVGGPGQVGGRTLAATANIPNVGLALGIVTSVGAPPVMAVTIVGVFLLRSGIGLVVARVLARRAEHAPHTPEARPTGA